MSRLPWRIWLQTDPVFEEAGMMTRSFVLASPALRAAMGAQSHQMTRHRNRQKSRALSLPWRQAMATTRPRLFQRIIWNRSLKRIHRPSSQMIVPSPVRAPTGRSPRSETSWTAASSISAEVQREFGAFVLNCRLVLIESLLLEIPIRLSIWQG